MILCCACTALPAWGAPPMQKAMPGRANAPSGLRSAPLDLTPPLLAGVAATRFAEFARPSDGGEDKRLAPLGAAMNQERTSTRAEAFIQRFHREGLPLARLWQGHAAVVSLGLNPKGKPGLWLVKQTH
jgi:hypothetical protein